MLQADELAEVNPEDFERLEKEKEDCDFHRRKGNL